MSTTIKERPILFSGTMVRALLDGTKTQTRRTLKRQPWASCSIEEGNDGESPFVYSALHGAGPGYDVEECRTACVCPYGQPGDRLWVRETWADLEALSEGNFEREAIYRADDIERYGDEDEYVDVTAPDMRWRPSIFMPRWASRILLEVVSVRVERLQDISEADAQAEGARRFPDLPIGTPSFNPCRWSMEAPTSTDQCLSTARYAFANYFCKVNGKGRGGVHDPAPWDANPMVWVVEFKRVTT